MLNTKSLREQVYDYLRNQINSRKILPGASINLNEISSELGISKTPLRDAIIQLEIEGFVTVLPRRGVIVNRLTLAEIRNSCEIIGALEGSVIDSVFEGFGQSHILKMKKLNAEMRQAILVGEYDRYYQLNLRFHDIFLDLSKNTTLKKIIMPIKQRLYDFPRRTYIKEWELNNCDEHDDFIEAIERHEKDRAISIIRDVHWSFTAQEDYIRQFYADTGENETPKSANGRRMKAQV